MLAWQISRIGMIWLFVAVVITVAPFLVHLPLWVLGIPAFGLVWRIGIYRGIWGAPGRVVKVLLVFAAMAGLGVTFNRFYGLEPMTSLLICTYGLKLLETRHRRDALVVIYLGYFVAAVYALFDQSLLTGGFLLVAYCLVTASLAGVHQTDAVREIFRPLRKASVILLQSVPLMVIFFLIMPRLGSFWSVPTPKSAVTGMSDRLSIGDITQLGTSSKTAFRVRFDGELPAKSELYWRGLTFSNFDGKTWKPITWGFKDGMVQWFGSTADWQEDELTLEGEPFSYEVILERQNGQWLFALPGSLPLSPGTGVTRMQTLVSMVPVTKRFQYRVRSWPEMELQASALSKERRDIELALPDNFNPRTRALAEQWSKEAVDAQTLIARLLEFYRANFSYTLQPPALGENSVDDFLFASRRGFCEHFASSFVFFMRAAGVPARLVVGYQGGEVHPEEGYVTVKQYDAHAWSEVWLEGRGWIRVDPTSVVAPDRISMGLISLMSAPVVFSNTAMTLDKYRDVTILNELRLYLDSLDYAWGRWVLGYQNVQSDFLYRLLGKINFERMIIFIFAGSLIGLLPVLVYSFWPKRRQKTNIYDYYYRDFCAALASKGCERVTGETPRSFAQRCILQFPEQQGGIQAVTQFYERSRYGGIEANPGEFRQLVRGFKI